MFQKKHCFFIFLLPVGDKNIKARFLLKPCGAAGACTTANKNTACFSLHPLVFISSGESQYRQVNSSEGTLFFIFLLPAGDKNIKARFLQKAVRSCRRHRRTIENTSCSHRLCLSSSAAVNHSIVKKMFWVVAFIYILAYNACKDIKARFLLKPCGAAGAFTPT